MKFDMLEDLVYYFGSTSSLHSYSFWPMNTRNFGNGVVYMLCVKHWIILHNQHIYDLNILRDKLSQNDPDFRTLLN